MTKSEIRKSLKGKRNSLSFESVKSKSQLVKDNLFKLDIFNNDNFFVYLSFQNEVQTAEILSNLFKLKKHIFVPKISGKEMEMVCLDGKTTFQKNKFGIFEPIGKAQKINDFVAIMPCVAVDEKGNRIGFGGGYYDRFLNGKNVLKIVLCYDFQVVENFEPEKNDIPANIIVTDKRIIFCDKNDKKIKITHWV